MSDDASRAARWWASRLLGLSFLIVTATTAATAPSAAPRARSDDSVASPEHALRLYQQDRASAEARRRLDEASRRFPKRHDVHLALLDSHLMRGDVQAASGLLRRLEPELRSSVRFSFDAIYYLLQHRQAGLAEGEWRRVHARIQAEVEQKAESVSRLEQGEDLFVQGLLAAAALAKADAMRLLHEADTYGFPPLDSRQMLTLADTLYELREERLAVSTYQAFLEHWPQDTQARLHLALALQASQEPAAAVQQLERVLQDDPRFPGANYYLGTVLFDMKRNDEAKTRLERELKLNPRCGQCMAKLAHIAYLAGDDASSAAWLQKATPLDPEWGETNLVAGMLKIRAGDYVSAILHLLRVVQQQPDSIPAHYQLQIAYQRIGDPHNAKVHADAFKKLTEEQKARPVEEP